MKSWCQPRYSHHPNHNSRQICFKNFNYLLKFLGTHKIMIHMQIFVIRLHGQTKMSHFNNFCSNSNPYNHSIIIIIQLYNVDFFIYLLLYKSIRYINCKHICVWLRKCIRNSICRLCIIVLFNGWHCRCWARALIFGTISWKNKFLAYYKTRNSLYTHIIIIITRRERTVAATQGN